VVPSAYLYDKCSEPSAIVSLGVGENEEWVRRNLLRFIVLTTNTLSSKFNLWAGQNLEKKRGKEKSVSIIGLRAEESPDRRFNVWRRQ
jgi:hypothetical protein